MRTLLWLLLAALVCGSIATPLPEEDPTEVQPVSPEENTDVLVSDEEDEDVFDAEGRSFVGKVVEKVTHAGIKTAIKGAGKTVKKVVKKVVKGAVKGVSKGAKKVVKGAGKAIKAGASKAVKGVKKVVKKNVVKQGKKFIIKGVKQVAKVAAEELGEMAMEAIMEKVVGGGGNGEEEEVEVEEVEVEEEVEGEGEEGEAEGEGEEAEEEEDEGVELFDFVGLDEHCKCPNSKRCDCIVEVPGYETAKMNITLLQSLFEDNSEMRIGMFYGEEKALVHKFPSGELHKKCRKLPESMGEVQMCITSTGKKVDKDTGIGRQCFNFEFNDDAVVKCITQTSDFKLKIETLK